MISILRCVLLVLLGCRSQSPSGQVHEQSERFKLHIDGEFSPVTDGQTGEILQPAITLALDLRVRLVPSRRFPDGSYGRLMHLDGAEMSRMEGSGPQVLGTEIAGRVVELRMFPDGEILDISWGEKIAGQGRYLDAFDLIFPALSPAAPSIPDGERRQRSMIWPLRQAKTFRWDNTVEATWLNEGIVNVGEQIAWSLRYEGAWSTKGVTREAKLPQKWMATGFSSGTVRFAHDGSGMIEHELNWNRMVSVQGPSGVVTQDQRFVGTVERY